MNKLFHESSFLSQSMLMMALFYWIYDQFGKPPVSLRHLPYNNIFKTSWKVITGVPTREIHQDLSVPHLKNPGSHMYVRLERLGWTVHLTTPKAAKILLSSSKMFPKVTDVDFSGTLAGRFLAGPNVMSLNGQRWKEHRTIVNPVFKNRLPISLFGKKSSKLFTVLGSRYGKEKGCTFTVDISDVLFRWSLDVLGEGILGFDFQGIEEDESNPWATIYKKFDQDVKNPLFVLFPKLDQQYRWLFPKRQEAHANLDQFHKMIHQVVQEKREKLKLQKSMTPSLSSKEEDNANKKDLLTLMLESQLHHHDITPLTDEELIDNVSVFFAAGHDTTASSLAFAIYYLAKHPEIQEKARKEANEVLYTQDDPKENDILPNEQQLKQLKYNHQIIKETLRLNGTVVSLVTPRIATEDTEIMGQFIKKDTMLSVNIYDIHRNPNVWNDPHAFNPDRFADDGEWDHQPYKHLAWLPFGYASRQCIGFKFTIAEQLVLLSMLLRKYEWTLPEDSIHHHDVITNNIVVMNPINMRITFKSRY
ncbi:unnamed protein product [Cunninghamella blakesleeana]